MCAPSHKLRHRVYNVTAMSFTPAELAECIKKYIPNFEITYKPDSRQAIADSWPQIFDDSDARQDWNWQHQYDLQSLCEVMIKDVQLKYMNNETSSNRAKIKI